MTQDGILREKPLKAKGLGVPKASYGPPKAFFWDASFGTRHHTIALSCCLPVIQACQ